jgi:hypothetical protein
MIRNTSDSDTFQIFLISVKTFFYWPVFSILLLLLLFYLLFGFILFQLETFYPPSNFILISSTMRYVKQLIAISSNQKNYFCSLVLFPG